MKVRAKNNTMRKMLKHPIGGAFREDGTADWPDDSFTARRVRDGDVMVEAEVVRHPIVSTKPQH